MYLTVLYTVLNNFNTINIMYIILARNRKLPDDGVLTS